jgi:hypothetical protein
MIVVTPKIPPELLDAIIADADSARKSKKRRPRRSFDSHFGARICLALRRLERSDAIAPLKAAAKMAELTATLSCQRSEFLDLLIDGDGDLVLGKVLSALYSAKQLLTDLHTALDKLCGQQAGTLETTHAGATEAVKACLGPASRHTSLDDTTLRLIRIALALGAIRDPNFPINLESAPPIHEDYSI